MKNVLINLLLAIATGGASTGILYISYWSGVLFVGATAEQVIDMIGFNQVLSTVFTFVLFTMIDIKNSRKN